MYLLMHTIFKRSNSGGKEEHFGWESTVDSPKQFFFNSVILNRKDECNLE